MMQDADVRLVRRIKRDIVARGRDVDSVIEQVSCLIYLFFKFFFFFFFLNTHIHYLNKKIHGWINKY